MKEYARRICTPYSPLVTSSSDKLMNIGRSKWTESIKAISACGGFSKKRVLRIVAFKPIEGYFSLAASVKNYDSEMIKPIGKRKEYSSIHAIIY